MIAKPKHNMLNSRKSLDCENIQIDLLDNVENLSLAQWLIAFQVLWSDRVVVLDSAINSAEESKNFRYPKKALGMLLSLLGRYQEEMRKGRPDAEARRFLGSAYAA